MERIDSDFHLSIPLPGRAGVAELRRCDDHFFGKARALSIPIEVKTPILYSLVGRRLSLPQMYAVLSTLTGPSGDLYDDWKGDFAFPFKLTVRRGDRELRYLLKLTSYRSSVEPHLYRAESYTMRRRNAGCAGVTQDARVQRRMLRRILGRAGSKSYELAQRWVVRAQRWVARVQRRTT